MEEELGKGKRWESNNLFMSCSKYAGRNKKPKRTNKGKSTQSRDVEILTKEIISKGMNVVLQNLVPEDHIEASLSLNTKRIHLTIQGDNHAQVWTKREHWL